MYRIIFIGFSRRILSMLVLYICFLSLGATLFVFLERNYEEQRRHTALTSSKLVKSMVEVLRNETFNDYDIIRAFNYKHALWKYESEHVPVTWNLVYSEKVLFSMILITTIGYGNVAPNSDLGKYLCIVYTFLGIPLNVTLMRLLGLRFRSCLRSVLELSKTVLGGTWIPIVLGGLLYFTFFDVLLVFGPAAAIDAVEDWSYLQAVYYCFVSLSTIGLGDYVAGLAARRYGSDYYHIYVLLLFLWLVFGLAFVAMCLNLISYGMGTLLLDKMDCRCFKRAAAKKKIAPVYHCLAELNFKMAKGKPQAFLKMNVFEDFMVRCVANPESITEKCLLHVFRVAEELRLAIYDEIETDDKLTSEAQQSEKIPSSETLAEDFNLEPSDADSKSGFSSFLETLAGEKELTISKVPMKFASDSSEEEASSLKSDVRQLSGSSPHSGAGAGTNESTISKFPMKTTSNSSEEEVSSLKSDARQLFGSSPYSEAGAGTKGSTISKLPMKTISNSSEEEASSLKSYAGQFSGRKTHSEAGADTKESTISKMPMKTTGNSSEEEASSLKSDAGQFSGSKTHSEAGADTKGSTINKLPMKAPSYSSPHSEVGTKGPTISVPIETISSRLKSEQNVKSRSNDSVGDVKSVADGEYYSDDGVEGEIPNQETCKDDSTQKTHSCCDYNLGEKLDTISDKSAVSIEMKEREKSSELKKENNVQSNSSEDLRTEAEDIDRELADESSIRIVHKRILEKTSNEELKDEEH